MVEKRGEGTLQLTTAPEEVLAIPPHPDADSLAAVIVNHSMSSVNVHLLVF